MCTERLFYIQWIKSNEEFISPTYISEEEEAYLKKNSEAAKGR